VQKPDGPALGVDQIHRNTVGDCYGQQETMSGGGVPVHSFYLDPADPIPVPRDGGPVNLVAEDSAVHAGFGPTKGPPAGHDLADWRLGPESQVESPSLFPAPAGDASHDAIAFAPSGDFEPRGLAGDRGFPDS
jgi:hypothetical protein